MVVDTLFCRSGSEKFYELLTHIHEHNHYVTDDKHGHRHTQTELEHLPGAVHL